MTRPIDAAGFRGLLEDVDVPDSEIARYLRPAAGKSGAFAPVFEPDPDLVTAGALESAMRIGNGICRWRRRRRFRARLERGERLPVIVSEGDSWFQFPFVIEDVIDHLGRDHLVWSCGAAGDTAENMILERPEYMEALEEQADHVSAFLLSAAGNDVIGEDALGVPVLERLLKRQGSAARFADDLIDTARLAEVLDRLRVWYRAVIANVRSRFPTLPILIHGYDYARPHADGPQDPRRPYWAARNAWLGQPMDARNISDAAMRREIVRLLIDRLYGMLEELVAVERHVHLVDCRGVLTRVEDWADEIHGTSEGFARIAARFRAVLQDLVRGPVLPEAAMQLPQSRPAKGGSTALAPARPVKAPPLILGTRRDIAVPPAIMGVSDARQMARGFAEKRRLERAVGADDSVPVRFLREGAARGAAVCRILASGIGYDGLPSEGWLGTGFLVAPNILLTNHHVINSRDVAALAVAQFGFEETSKGKTAKPAEHRLDPERLFLASPFDQLDYAFVWILGAPQDRFGTVEFWRGSFLGAPGSYANVIHHPEGAPKRASLKRNAIIPLGFDDVLVHYAADTEGGSSGAPVFNDDWKLFALHHAAQSGLSPAVRRRMREAGYHGDVLNEGIKTSAIAADIDARARTGAVADQGAAELRRIFAGTDSRMGVFGDLGRPVPFTEDAFERVTATYRATATDIDIAFRDLAWFGPEGIATLDDLATTIADLNLDIWVIHGISPATTEALVTRLRSVFGLDFDWAATEPGARQGCWTTMVVWNSLTVRGRRRDWPEAAGRLFRMDTRAGSAVGCGGVPSPALNSVPGLLHFTALNRDKTFGSFEFHLVLLGAEARDGRARRRGTAADIVAHAIGAMAAAGDAAGDWVIDGDVSADLSAGRVAMVNAPDWAARAVTFLRSKCSLIETIFLSPGMEPVLDRDGVMTVAPDRVRCELDCNANLQRPATVRLSLADGPRDGRLAKAASTRVTSACQGARMPGGTAAAFTRNAQKMF